MAYISVVAALVVVATGCGGAHRYDVRLVAADSLMWEAPDSALAVLGVIDSLGGEANRAYRDLLVTQARYKCYQEITALDDSVVTRAMDYYRAHSGEREKLTRAYLYKGAVMEELGHVDSAMYYYKTAEVNADEKDYTNLGQINTRIAKLYRLNYANEQTCFERYKRAYHYYTKSGNKELQLNSLYCMVMMNGITHQEQQETLYKKAVRLAEDLKDESELFLLYEIRCRQLSQNDTTCKEAKRIALQCLNNYGKYINNDLLMDLSYLYLKENKIDSVKYFMQYVDESMKPAEEQRIKVRKYEILSAIAEYEGKPIVSTLHQTASNSIADSILNNTNKYQIEKIENAFNIQRHHDTLSRVSILQWGLISLSVIAIFLIVLLAGTYLRRMHHTKAIIKELENINLTHSNELFNQFDADNTAIGHLIANLVSILKTCVSEANMQNSTTQLARQIKQSIVDVADDSFWNELRSYLDHEHNNMISTIADNPDISKKDLKFIELSCCGFSYLEIAMILDYSPRYVLNKRKIIAQKLGIQKPLQDYLNDLMAKKGQ